MSRLLRLWRGELPLKNAFWDWAVIGGIAVNGATMALFLALIVNRASMLWLILVYLAPLPYNAMVAVGVWRSADRHPGDPRHARLAKIVSAVGLILLSLA